MDLKTYSEYLLQQIESLIFSSKELLYIRLSPRGPFFLFSTSFPFVNYVSQYFGGICIIYIKIRVARKIINKVALGKRQLLHFGSAKRENFIIIPHAIPHEKAAQKSPDF